MVKILGKFEDSLGLRIFFFLSTSFFLIYCASKHIPWRDEYQTFLVSTRTKSWGEFWTATRYERTPPLHYLLQRFLWPVLNGFIDPRTFIRVVTLPFTFLTFFLLFFRFRFPPWIALMLAMNVYFFREWGVISRSYALGGALVLLSLDFRQRGKVTVARILLALSAATHLLFFLGSGAILTLDYLETIRSGRGKSRTFAGTLLFTTAILGIIAFHSIPPVDSQFTTSPSFPGYLRSVSEVLHEISVAFLPVETWGFDAALSRWWAWNQSPLGFAWSILFAIPLWYAFRRDRGLLARLGFVLLPIFVLFVSAFGPALRHTGVLYVFLVYYLAQIEKEKRNRTAFFGLIAGPFIASLFWLWVWNPFEPRFAFADGPNLVSFVEEAEHIYTLQDYILFPTMAETGREVFDVRYDRVAVYPNFRIAPFWHTMDEFCARKDHYPLKSGDLFVFQGADNASAARLGNHCGIWSPVYESRGNFATDESFKIFRYQGAGE